MHNSAARRSQTFSSGFSSSYDPSLDAGRGPIFSKSTFGVPHFYPRDLKKRVDDYVVGQERAKKTICSVLFNHYQGLRRRQHLEFQDQRLWEKRQRTRHNHDRDMWEQRDAHSLEDDSVPGYDESVRHAKALYDEFETNASDLHAIEQDPNSVVPHVKIDKSNLLLIGPTGVGKTFILETLSNKLSVPFTISDCNSFTQAGYIGQDVETCVERLLVEANYDVQATEHGIIVLDEFDKLAKRESMNGRDVGGEGVQQALLKLVEGSKVTVNVKENRSSRSATPIHSSNYTPPGSNPSSPASQPSGRVEQYTIDTTNILFVFCGAFVGLDKAILRRVSKPSLGFGAAITSRTTSLSGSKEILPAAMYAHLPHQPLPVAAAAAAAAAAVTEASPSTSRLTTPTSSLSPSALGFTPLDLTTPADLQVFGFIPELIGRMHNICALAPLSLAELFRILTEPRNSLVAQYTALFETYPSRLFFTRRALHAIARRAAANETGARGLKMEMERVLAEPMFDAPTPYVLITEACVDGREKAGYWGKDGRLDLMRRLNDEDDEDEAHAAAVGLAPARDSLAQYRETGQSSA